MIKRVATNCLSFSGLRKREEATGNQVSPKNMAPRSAKLNERAIGRNIFPSTPLKERTGMKTIRMITCPKMAALRRYSTSIDSCGANKLSYCFSRQHSSRYRIEKNTQKLRHHIRLANNFTTSNFPALNVTVNPKRIGLARQEKIAGLKR